MKDIRIYVVHKAVCDIQSFFDYYKIGALGKEFNFIWEKNTPDYVIATEHIYFYKECLNDFKRLVFLKDIVKIFVATELYMPDFNVFDYCIGFNDQVTCADRYAQLLTPDAFFTKFVKTMENSVTKEDAHSLLQEKKSFCNFLYSNSEAHENRDKMFFKLSEYRRVDSLGKWMNNMSTNVRGGGYGISRTSRRMRVNKKSL